jgi:hypothetical protein
MRSVSASATIRRRGRRQVDEGSWPAHDHAFDLIGEANRTGGVGDGSQTMIARQPSDQSKVLLQHRTTGTRRPEQNAARTDEARRVFRCHSSSGFTSTVRILVCPHCCSTRTR